MTFHILLHYGLEVYGGPELKAAGVEIQTCSSSLRVDYYIQHIQTLSWDANVFVARN